MVLADGEIRVPAALGEERPCAMQDRKD
jgi:hypothetical protein